MAPLERYHGYRSEKPRRLSRKGFALGIATALAVIPLAAGCSNPPQPEIYLGNCDKISSNSYTAASSIVVGILSSSEHQIKNDTYKSFGHAGLYEINNTLWLATAEHVIDHVRDGNHIVATFCGQNDKTYSIELPTQEETYTTFFETRRDKLVGYPIAGLNSRLDKAIADGEISPLKVRGVDSIEEGQPLGIVNSEGELTQFTYGGTGTRPGEYEFLDGGEVCEGQSGSSVIVLDDQGKPTGEAVGQVAIGGTIFEVCSDYSVGFIPFKSS